MENIEGSSRVAGLCCAQGFYDSSTSLAYYGTFRVIRVALMAGGFMRPEQRHAALHATFASELTRRRRQFPWSVRAICRSLKRGESQPEAGRALAVPMPPDAEVNTALRVQSAGGSHDVLACLKELSWLTNAEGDGDHCETTARSFTPAPSTGLTSWRRCACGCRLRETLDAVVPRAPYCCTPTTVRSARDSRMCALFTPIETCDVSLLALR
jgi:hypothetical protein